MKTGVKLMLACGLSGLGLLAAGTDGAKPMVSPTGAPLAVDASMFVAGGMDVGGIDVSRSIKAPRADVFKRFTTSEGWKLFCEADSRIELKPGGLFEIYFASPEATPSERGANGCQILSYVPDEMVTFSWNAPPKFPEERAKRAWVVVTFTGQGDETVVRLRHLGFGKDGHWPDVKKYFENAWPNVLRVLAESFEKNEKK